MHAIKKYLKYLGCKDILLGVFVYNKNVLKFYQKH